MTCHIRTATETIVIPPPLRPAMSSSDPRSDEFLYRLLTRDEWEAALQLGHYPPTALDRSSGFIHLSTLSEAITTANLYFATSPSLLLMQLSTSSLHPHLTFDAVPTRSSPHAAPPPPPHPPLPSSPNSLNSPAAPPPPPPSPCPLTSPPSPPSTSFSPTPPNPTPTPPHPPPTPRPLRTCTTASSTSPPPPSSPGWRPSTGGRATSPSSPSTYAQGGWRGGGWCGRRRRG